MHHDARLPSLSCLTACVKCQDLVRRLTTFAAFFHWRQRYLIFCQIPPCTTFSHIFIWSLMYANFSLKHSSLTMTAISRPRGTFTAQWLKNTRQPFGQPRILTKLSRSIWVCHFSRLTVWWVEFSTHISCTTLELKETKDWSKKTERINFLIND